MRPTVLKLKPVNYDAYMITWYWPGNHLYITNSFLSYKEKETIGLVINSLSDELGISEISIDHTDTVQTDRRLKTLLEEWETFIVREEGDRSIPLGKLVRDTLRARDALPYPTMAAERIQAL